MSKEKVKKTTPKEEKLFDEEEGNKTVVSIILVVIAIILIIIGLLIGCQKTEEEKDPGIEVNIPTDKGKDTVVEPVKEVKTSVKKTSSKTPEREKRYFIVTFNYNDEERSHTHKEKVLENEKVPKYNPGGFEECIYSKDIDFTEEFDFSKPIKEDTEVYMYCYTVEYTINYDVETENPTSYTVLDGKVPLVDYEPEEGVFYGWCLDNECNNMITELSQDVIKYATSENVINIKAKVLTEVSYEIYGTEEEPVESDTFEVTNDSATSITMPSARDASLYCKENENLLGFSNNRDNRILYDLEETVVLDRDMKFYAVCGSAVVIYESEGEIETVGYTTEEIEEYALPTVEDLGLETPTYFIKAEETTDTSKIVVEDEVDYLAENEIRLDDVVSNASEYYTPEVGDIVEELEKEFKGWTTEDTDPESETYQEQIEVPEDFKPVENETIELEAVWEEQVLYDVPTEVVEIDSPIEV